MKSSISLLTVLTIIVLLFANPRVYGQTQPDTAKASSEIIYYACPMHPEIKSFNPGTCSKCGMNLEQKKATSVKADQKKESVYYTCSMHPDVKESKPGKCPKCGMELIKKSSNDPPSKGMKMKCPMWCSRNG